MAKITQAMVSLGDSVTLAQLYAQLTSSPAASTWPALQAAVKALPNGVTSDDPFGGAPQLSHLANLDSSTIEAAGKIFASILADLAAGKADHQIVAKVRAILSAPA